MTSIFRKVKPGDLITSDLFNQITDKIEEMHEITAVMEIKKNSETDSSEPGSLSVKSNVGIGTKDLPSEKLEINGTVKTGNDGQYLLLKGLNSSKKGEESSMNLDFMTSSQGRTSSSVPTASFRAIDDEYFSSHLGFLTKETSPDQNNLTERLRITSNGNVGIGITEPSEKLEVSGAVKASKFIGDGSGLTGITGGKAGQWTDIEGGIYYDKGKVGIGTINPSAILEVNGNIKAKSIESKPAVHSFNVEGDSEQFYPIVFKDENWGDGPMVLEINRPDVNTDSDQRGSLISKFTAHSTKGKNGADICHAEIYYNHEIKKEFIAGYENVPDSADFVVWLRGGKTTYSFRSNHFVTLNSSAEAKILNNKPYSLKTSVESYVVKNGIHFDKGLVIDSNVGIGIITPSEKLEVKGAVKADKFMGDGSGLTGIKTSQWNDVTDGISCNKGNVGIEGDNVFIKTRIFPSDDKTAGLTGFSLESREQEGKPHTWKIYTAPVGGGHGVPANSLTFWEYGSKSNGPKLVLQANTGNVGIGTTTPSATLEVNGNIKVSKQINQDNWTELKPDQILNGWRNFDSGYNNLGYFLDKNGIVHLKGLIKGGEPFRHKGGGVNDENACIIFKLPQNCCPAYRELHIVGSYNEDGKEGFDGTIGLGRCDIIPNGDVIAIAGSKVWFSLDGITFRAK